MFYKLCIIGLWPLCTYVNKVIIIIYIYAKKNKEHYEYVGASTCTAGAVPRWRIGRKDLGRGADGTSGSGHYPGQSTYGGDYLLGASGSGGFPGQWTHGGDVVSGTIGAVDSSIIMDCTTS